MTRGRGEAERKAWGRERFVSCPLQKKHRAEGIEHREIKVAESSRKRAERKKEEDSEKRLEAEGRMQLAEDRLQ